MLDVTQIIRDGLILSFVATLIIGISMWINPRLWLQDYPKDIQALVPPKTEKEKRQTNLIGIPFLLVLIGIPFISTLMLKQANAGNISFLLLFVNAFGVFWIGNLWDLLVVDWLIGCTFTPKFVILPGTEGAAGYKDYAFHFRGFLIGTVISIIVGVIIAALVSLV
ncbi:MAG: nitroreductase [Anaerolineae bacterium]|nr:nitroreductase [Anaerolineae bacterium]